MQGGPDACVGLCARYEQSADLETREDCLQVGVLEGVAVALVQAEFIVGSSQFRDNLPRFRSGDAGPIAATTASRW